MYSNFEMTYNSYLMHHGTKGMKWGVRRKVVRRSIMPGKWGIRRTVASQHNLDIKNNWTVAKNKAKAGVLSKQSEEYIHARDARMKNLGGRALAFAGGYWKSDQGRYYQHRAKGRSVVNAAARVYVRKALIGAAAGMAMSIGYNKVMGNI